VEFAGDRRQFEHGWFLDPAAESFVPLSDVRISQTVAVCIGPAGDWSPEERALMGTAGWNPFHLGPRIMRSETAALTAAALVASVWGRDLPPAALRD
jgi:16S rRNA (uracil1498-N3)-methyltransferase